MSEPTDLERAVELLAFLQGQVPKGIQIKHPPNLTADQADDVLYVLGEHFKGWSVPDSIRRCEVPGCGQLYDSDSEGGCLDFGESPHFFCDDCVDQSEYRFKITEAAESMDLESQKLKSARTRLLALASLWETSPEGFQGRHPGQLRQMIYEILGPE